MCRFATQKLTDLIFEQQSLYLNSGVQLILLHGNRACLCGAYTQLNVYYMCVKIQHSVQGIG